MTSEERFAQIEHITAGIAEERRKDREEYKTLWRDTQRQLNEVSTRLVQLSETVGLLAEESRTADQAFQAADKALQTRIESVVSGFGAFIAQNLKK